MSGNSGKRSSFHFVFWKDSLVFIEYPRSLHIVPALIVKDIMDHHLHDPRNADSDQPSRGEIGRIEMYPLFTPIPTLLRTYGNLDPGARADVE